MRPINKDHQSYTSNNSPILLSNHSPPPSTSPFIIVSLLVVATIIDEPAFASPDSKFALGGACELAFCATNCCGVGYRTRNVADTLMHAETRLARLAFRKDPDDAEKRSSP